MPEGPGDTIPVSLEIAISPDSSPQNIGYFLCNTRLFGNTHLHNSAQLDLDAKIRQNQIKVKEYRKSTPQPEKLPLKGIKNPQDRLTDLGNFHCKVNKFTYLYLVSDQQP